MLNESMEQIIQLADDDDITSIRSRLEWTEAQRVLMLVPGKNQALDSLVNLKILARSADKRNIQLALATRSMKARDLAEEAGLETFPTEWIARIMGFIGKGAEKVEPEKTDAPQLRLVDSPAPPRFRINDKKLILVIGSGRVNIWQQLGAMLLIGLLGAAMVGLAFALAPKATITLTPQIDNVETELTLIADPAPEITAIDVENNLIPARPVQVELTIFDEVETIDTEAAPVDFATGTVVFFNRTQDEQVIPISSTLRTSSGVPIEFVTSQTTTIPAGTGAIAPATVIAVEPGPSGNVSSGQINRLTNSTLTLLARVINEAPTSGGSVRQAGVVTEDDKDRVRSKLRQVIQQRGYEMILTDLDEQEFVPPETLQVIELDLSYNQFSGDVSETLGAEMRAVVRATAIGSYNANQLAYFSLLNQVPENQRLLEQSLQFSAGGPQEITDRSVTFSVMGEGIVVNEIDIDEVRSAITFMPIGEAQAWISENMPVVSVPGIEIEPNWLGRLPIFPFRMEVIVTDVEPLIFGGETRARVSP